MQTLKKQTQSEEGRAKRQLLFFRDDAFWRGVASVFDIFGQGNRLLVYDDPWETDYEALRGDWEMIGQDMRQAIEVFKVEYAEELPAEPRLFDPDNNSPES